ncbi:hypothetical protein D3C74_432170 [compost metagenome]
MSCLGTELEPSWWRELHMIKVTLWQRYPVRMEKAVSIFIRVVCLQRWMECIYRAKVVWFRMDERYISGLYGRFQSNWISL